MKISRECIDNLIVVFLAIQIVSAVIIIGGINAIYRETKRNQEAIEKNHEEVKRFHRAIDLELEQAIRE